ncbi:twin-arginine translocase TatA/TatE family subunit [Cardiobacteriaceae bacterium TAE3-ERU3]|nr:twin-arginine translocase TatA/TatE family subunit [Cardiobacteriaceae bacterium TAE3-ERU3]
MGISPIQLLIVLVIVVLIFGGKRLRSLGSDLGHAIKGFKEVSKDDKKEEDAVTQERINQEQHDDRIIDAEVKREDKTHLDR